MERPQPIADIVIEDHLLGMLGIYCVTPAAAAWIAAEAPHFGIFRAALTLRGVATLIVQPNFDVAEVEAWLLSYNDRRAAEAPTSAGTLSMDLATGRATWTNAAGETTVVEPGEERPSLARHRERLLELAYDAEQTGNTDTATVLRQQAHLGDAELRTLYPILP